MGLMELWRRQKKRRSLFEGSLEERDRNEAAQMIFDAVN